MFQKNSSYAQNKRSKCIVYQYADGFFFEISDDICPDFSLWKDISDEDYHEQELHEQRTCRRNVSLFEISDEVSIEEPPASRRHDAKKILRCLTKLQQRRFFFLRHYHGKTTREIADIEGVSQHAIMLSLQAADRKIQKNRKNTYSNAPKNDVS